MEKLYANMKISSGEIAVIQARHGVPGNSEVLQEQYRLNAVEKATLLRKMDAYCQEQTGQSLKDYSAQRLAEDMEPPTQPSM